MLRALLSFLASCYAIAAIVLTPFALLSLNLPRPGWWALYLFAELVLLGVPVALAIWMLFWRPAAALQSFAPARFWSLTAMALLPLYAFFVVPVGLWISLRGRTGATAGWGVVVASMVVLAAAYAYGRSAAKRRGR